MTLYEAILHLYPELATDPTVFMDTIQLRDDCDGSGPYIDVWEHPLPRPTADQLAALVTTEPGGQP